MPRALVLVACAALASCTSLHRGPEPEQPLIRSVISVDTVAGTVTMPAFRGRIRDTLVWFIVTEASDRNEAHRRGVSWAPRLAMLANTPAAQYGQVNDGMLEYSAGVDFSPTRVMRPAPDSGFPPLEARAGSVGRRGYSPFVQLARGVILNAPIIATEQGALDRVISLDAEKGQVVLKMSRGYANDRHAWYISTEASDELVASFERATYVPSLASAPGIAATDANSSRSGLLAIVNGETDRASPERQGLRSALISDLSPLNILQHAPDPTENDVSYSPLWDMHLAQWSASAINSNQREKVFTFDEAAGFAKRGLLTSAKMGPKNAKLGALQAAGVAINCPIIITFSRGAM